MYSKVLVPLDGSNLAEVALPHAEQLGCVLDSEITLLRVIPPPQGVFDEEGREIVSTDAAIASAVGAADDYLTRVAEGLRKKGVKNVKKEVTMGDPAEVIIDFARGSGSSAIAMATHGRSGITRWVYGSVAEKVLRHATVPVLLVRAGTRPEAK